MKLYHLYLAINLILISSVVNACPIERIVFFGDSLTDNGNLYNATLKIFPPSPPNFKGRFLNGPTWAENVGNYYTKKYGIDYEIYAWGGATAISHLPIKNLIGVVNLSSEVRVYLLGTLFENKKNVLYFIWIGHNDYLSFGNLPPELLVQNVTRGIVDAITTLINAGATNFVILNLIDPSNSPYIKAKGTGGKLHSLIVLNNIKLEDAVSNLKRNHPKVKIYLYDVYRLFNDYLAHPEKYDAKYGFTLTDSITPCWKEKLSLTSLLFSKNNGAVCLDSNNHIYWDSLHLTEPFHVVLSKIVINLINHLLYKC